MRLGENNDFEDFIRSFSVDYGLVPKTAQIQDIFFIVTEASFKDKTIIEIASLLVDSYFLDFLECYRNSFDKKQYIIFFLGTHFINRSKGNKFDRFFAEGYKFAVKGSNSYCNDILAVLYNLLGDTRLTRDQKIYSSIRITYEYIYGYSMCMLLSELKKFSTAQGYDINFDLPVDFLNNKSTNMTTNNVINLKKPKVFITYSWDNDGHKDWVRGLADILIKNGIEVLLDQYDIQPGDSFTEFMEQSVEYSDNVVVVLTPNYKTKSLERKGGVGYEQQIISGEIFSGMPRNKFVPIIRNGTFDSGENCAIPPHFKGIATIDFISEDRYESAIEELLRTIYKTPRHLKPAVGSKPTFQFTANAKKKFTFELNNDFTVRDPAPLAIHKLAEINDLRAKNEEYDVFFQIDGLSAMVQAFSVLQEKDNLTVDEAEKINMLRSNLNNVYFLPNGTLYEYLEYSLNSILDYHSKLLGNNSELFDSIQECFKLFANKSYNIEGKGFDVIHINEKWNFRVYISNMEVEKLHSVFGTKDNLMLTIIAGLDVSDFSNETIRLKVIPKQSYSFTHAFFSRHIGNEKKDEYFTLSNWKIGIA